ncbi:MAG: hypothetical protein WBJ81_01430 [Rickettsiales bacterium]
MFSSNGDQSFSIHPPTAPQITPDNNTHNQVPNNTVVSHTLRTVTNENANIIVTAINYANPLIRQVTGESETPTLIDDTFNESEDEEELAPPPPLIRCNAMSGINNLDEGNDA